MTCVIIESPYAGERQQNETYLRHAIRYCALVEGASPYASHRMLTDALNEDDPKERQLGIALGYEWWQAADEVWFFVDLGWSPGMKAALELAARDLKPVRFISLHENPDASASSRKFLSRLYRDPKSGLGVQPGDKDQLRNARRGSEPSLPPVRSKAGLPTGGQETPPGGES